MNTERNTLNLSIFILLILCSHSYKVSDFQPSILQPSPPSGFHTINTGQQTIGEILAFGDLNGDQYNDYIATPNKTTKLLYLYFWNPSQLVFTRDNFTIKTQSTINSTSQQYQQIQQIMLSDLNSDGHQQIIITYLKQDETYQIVIYQLGNCTLQYVCDKSLLMAANGYFGQMTNVPFLVNFKGDKSRAFFTFQGAKRYVYEPIADKPNTYEKKQFKQYLTTNNNQNNQFNLIDKHYAANIDFNGDCHSDLIITSQNSNEQSILQFYQKQQDGKLTLKKQMMINSQVQFVTYIDYDASGTIDIAFILKMNTEYQLYILPNQNEEVSDICTSWKQFPFVIGSIKKIEFPDYLSEYSKLHFGDIDGDSFPDILTIIRNKDFNKANIYKNTQDDDGNRVFHLVQSLNANLLAEIKNPVQVAYFDLAENGILDIFVMSEQTKASDGMMVVTRNCIMNNVKDDTLFIKMLPLSQSSVYSLTSNRISSAFGVTIQWKITKLDGNKKIELSNQKFQWNYGILQLPFITSGLGRTNNYIQDLTVGYQGAGVMSWSPVIPNSKLLVYKKQDGTWSLQTLLTNSQRVNQVVYISIGILILLGIIIIVLNHRQKQQDRKDQYNFIQLIR